MAEVGVEVAAQVEARDVEVSARFARGRVTAVLGPNGAGKSTLMRLIAGELKPDGGEVLIDGTLVASPTVFVPPHRRTVALLAQRPLLFPHLRVLDNVAFGVRARGGDRASARARAAQELEAVGAGRFASRWPTQLSGGEAQRVALARALATDPTVVLLDEPLAAQDVSTAAEVRGVLSRRLSGMNAAIGLVTHDPLDVWALADDVIAMEGGRCVESGGVADVLHRPATAFLARLGGTNLVRGTVVDEGLSMGSEQVAGLWDESRTAHPGHAGLATFAPSAVALFREQPQGSPRNSWPMTVTGFVPRGDVVRVEGHVGDEQVVAADVTAPGLAALALTTGDVIWAQVKATQVTLYAR